MNGMVPPPFESIAEKKWVKENKVVPYIEDEKMPMVPKLAAGATEKTIKPRLVPEP
jgi:hypothetical protein